jgi:large subunit ribosomal protein L21
MTITLQGLPNSAALAVSSVSSIMYAIIAADGRQYKVSTGDEIQLDLRDGAQEGDSVTFDNVLLVSGDGGVKVGKPKVAGATVAAEVVGQEMGDKLYIQKMRRRKNFRRRTGHRQMYTRVRIGAITG